MSLASIPRPLREQVATRDGCRCRYCSLSQVGQAASFDIDHIVPRAAGGVTTIENLALQCSHSGLRKAAKTRAVDPLTAERVNLFHPLGDHWHDHFRLLRDGALDGRTPVGRATIAALAMNHRNAKVARAMQLMNGIIEVDH